MIKKNNDAVKQYDVEIAESLIRRVPVMATSEVEAIALISEKYRQAKVVLTADDFVDVSFSAREV